MKKLNSVIICLFISNFLSAQLAFFNFNSSPYLEVSNSDLNVSVSNVMLSSGTISTNITTGSYFPNEPYIEETGGWTASDQLSAKSFQFTITANSGYTFSISNIEFKAYSTSAGPTAIGFAIGSTNLYQVNAPDGSLINVNQVVSGQSGLTTATIKIQGWLNNSRTSTGGGDFRLDDIIITGMVVLPIDLKSYKVNLNDNVIDHFFVTTSETNNDYFTIERSADGQDFSAIGMIDGAGNSNSEINYEFTDEKPLGGINYYRIKQTDFDGQYSYSDIRSVRFRNHGGIQVNPRATEDRLNITTDLNDYVITIINAAGQTIRRFASMSLNQTISIEDLHSGLYFVRVSSRTESETIKVIKI